MDDDRSLHELKSNWRTVANMVTMTRGLLTVPIVFALLRQDLLWDKIAAVLFVIAAASDGLDGYLARARDEESAFGALLDPVADKVLGIAVLSVLVWNGGLPSWMLWSLFIKEGALLIGGMLLLRNGKSVPKARSLGKWATFILFIGIIDVIGGFSGWGTSISTVGVVVSLCAGVEYAMVAFGLTK